MILNMCGVRGGTKSQPLLANGQKKTGARGGVGNMIFMIYKLFKHGKTIGPQAACERCHGTECPLLTALFSLLLFSFRPDYSSPRRGYCMVPKFCMGV